MSRLNSILNNIMGRPLARIRNLSRFEEEDLQKAKLPTEEYLVGEILAQEVQPQGIVEDAEGVKFLAMGILVPIPMEMLPRLEEIETLRDLMPLPPTVSFILAKQYLPVGTGGAVNDAQEGEEG